MSFQIILLLSLVLNASVIIVACMIYLRLQRLKHRYRYVSRQLDILGAEYFSLNSNK